MSALHAYLDQQVLTLTQDGRVIIGKLIGVDGVGSVILSGCVERIFSADAPVEEVPLGLYLVRGDAISMIGDIDTEIDKAQDLNTVRADPIPDVRHY
ncbi:uncharacterized protein FA14DRAFT_127389 [Meira miltonrushii]|uniref:LSM2-LSM8 complex subunit LSM8 n=1 Tax=Meira miltonrushii TaxID=1280837 RepID=A0A316V473_9BASI|nr:uncharacterized protein FA14DRAFT_127389 [Meira miltonrushii]PWN32320.1 hypothetical protein FA14DRAFT_127389 [Meira miltonrushii]